MHSMSMSPYLVSVSEWITYFCCTWRKFTEIVNNVQESLSYFLSFVGGMSMRALIVGGSGWTPLLDITSTKKGMDVHLK